MVLQRRMLEVRVTDISYIFNKLNTQVQSIFQNTIIGFDKNEYTKTKILYKKKTIDLQVGN